MQVETYIEKSATKESLIETSYTGTDSRFSRTKGEAFYNASKNQWFYRPFNQTTEFFVVNPKEIECASDKGWLKGDYVGDRDFPRKGKAYWVDGCWNYKPAGTQKEYRIPEGKFIPVRDVDIYEGSDTI